MHAHVLRSMHDVQLPIIRKAACRRKFEFFDRDGDGYINRIEAVRLLEPNGFVEARRKIVLVSKNLKTETF